MVAQLRIQYFANLCPEAILREIKESQIKIYVTHDLATLAKFGQFARNAIEFLKFKTFFRSSLGT